MSEPTDLHTDTIMAWLDEVSDETAEAVSETVLDAHCWTWVHGETEGVIFAEGAASTARLREGLEAINANSMDGMSRQQARNALTRAGYGQ